jgi:tRNA pseudouridine38-40 synthase
MRNIKLVLEYDGTNYHGWQSQSGSGKPTIQDALEQALVSLTHEETKTFGSGRTDAKVHAFGQVVNFQTRSSIPAEAWAPALNHFLPNDIRVLTSEETHEAFHARHSASGKIYTYRILNRRAPTSLYRNHCWHVNLPLNLRSMRKAASSFLGVHDFSAFRGSGCSAKNPVRNMRSLVVRKNRDFVELWFEADAFLQYMVRNITGTLVEVGLGRFRPDDVERMLLSKDRSEAGRTAPPQGLYLVRVLYDSSKRGRKNQTRLRRSS